MFFIMKKQKHLKFSKKLPWWENKNIQNSNECNILETKVTKILEPILTCWNYKNNKRSIDSLRLHRDNKSNRRHKRWWITKRTMLNKRHKKHSKENKIGTIHWETMSIWALKKTDKRLKNLWLTNFLSIIPDRMILIFWDET